ncbi:hypothetical protein LOAG_04075 [Loa loa]|uniref:Uncharacterized protein n=1 Tax=Loa loa TaxID=7209 RepID=A0A1S0U3E3_LOALO|nr:hypothetical protein LOAG_04075 [Loa loa]EFO24405.1 hypothetical protein LOAG_04075 [Loa loa]
MRSSTVPLSIVLVWCIYYKLSCAKQSELANNMQISNVLSENDAQSTEFVRTAWSAATYSKLRIYREFLIIFLDKKSMRVLRTSCFLLEFFKLHVWKRAFGKIALDITFGRNAQISIWFEMKISKLSSLQLILRKLQEE